MLDTAAAYKTAIGLHPDAEKHGIYADFEPVSIFLIAFSFIAHRDFLIRFIC